jgi:alginate O-acetyltransferase complex protein AlgI
MGVCMERLNKVQVLSFSLAVLAAILVFFKLYDGGSMLPVGMSFYLFQIAGYLIDVYRQKLEPEKNILAFSAQIMMFPKLLSGPLMNPKDLQNQQRTCRPDGQRFLNGLKTLVCGLGLKVVVANRLGSLWAQGAVVGYESISVPFAWLCLVGYAMQLYFDFYGYSLMAIGIGRMLGYELPENFLHPYISKTVSEFYRRWHATLGTWFREYLYIPLGGNRKGTVRTIVNLAVVWLFTGLWHGVGGNYLLWAGFLFLLIVNERLWLGKILKKLPLIGHVYVVFVILLSWVPFAVGDFSQMVVFLGRLFGLGGQVLNPADYILWGRDYAPILLSGVILATPLPAKLCARLKNTLLGDILILVLFWVVVYFISTAAQDPFLYFAY